MHAGGGEQACGRSSDSSSSSESNHSIGVLTGATVATFSITVLVYTVVMIALVFIFKRRRYVTKPAHLVINSYCVILSSKLSLSEILWPLHSETSCPPLAVIPTLWKETRCKTYTHRKFNTCDNIADSFLATYTVCCHFLCSTEIPLNSCPAYGDMRVQPVGEGGEEPPYEVTDIMGSGVGVEDEDGYIKTN